MKTIIETDNDFICDIQAPCFQLISKEEAEWIQSSKTQVFFRRGENLTKQGAFASYVLFIIKGYAKQYVEGDSTRNYNLKIVKPGEFVGLSAVFSQNTFNYSTVALTETQVYLIEKNALASVVQHNGMFAFNIIKRYCEQNNVLFDSVKNLIYKQMNGRMADVLLYLDGLRNECPELFQLLSRKDMADFAGISTESAVKLLKTFEKDGLITLDEKDITLNNIESLAEISKRG